MNAQDQRGRSVPTIAEVPVDRSALLRRAAERAHRAPSIHNTQPWKFVLIDGTLEIHAEPRRRLPVLDPRGRQLMISLGAALYNARVTIAAAGYEPLVHRFPDRDRHGLVAQVRVGGLRYEPGSTALELAIDRRRTNRRAFADEPVPEWLISELRRSADSEDTVLFPVTRPEHRSVVAALSELADQLERGDPAYLAELAAWTTDDPQRTDGVQAASVPYAGSQAGRRDPLPLRAFDVRGMGWLPASSGSDANQCLLLLCAHDDEPFGWLRAGEALEHVWLRLTDRGYWASPLTQLIEVRRTHEQLQAQLGLVAQPQLLLRVGRAPEAAATLRRPASEVIVDHSEFGAHS